MEFLPHLIGHVPGAAYPKKIKSMEEMMIAYTATLPDKNWDKPDWSMPKRNKNKQWNEKPNRNTGSRSQRGNNSK